jgi:hypothetical protein
MPPWGKDNRAGIKEFPGAAFGSLFLQHVIS